MHEGERQRIVRAGDSLRCGGEGSSNAIRYGSRPVFARMIALKLSAERWGNHRLSTMSKLDTNL